MLYKILNSITSFFIVFLFCSEVFALKDLHFKTNQAEVIIPSSSLPRPHGLGASTDIIVTKPYKKLKSGLPYGETPASIACVYGLTKNIPGCPIDKTTEVPTGGWGAIALVDAYYYAAAENDLNIFSSTFNLPQCTTSNNCFHQIVLGSTSVQGWEDEQNLDTQWAHAMAPNAQIYLVEAASGAPADLFAAVQVAAALVAPTGGIVSMSWSFPEFPSELTYDSYFQYPGVVFISSSGDYSAPARYPSASPYVISAGGTTIVRNAKGLLVDENAWSTRGDALPGEKSGASGGPSLYESRPAFQNVVQKIVGAYRGTPDISFDANPKSGVLVYSTFRGGWIVDGGTSAAAPSLAGIINSANHRARTTTEELNYIYGNYIKNYHQYWHDILHGYNGYPALVGYDFTTGLGSPRTYAGK